MTFSGSVAGNEDDGMFCSAAPLLRGDPKRRGSPNTTASAPKVAAFSSIFWRFESSLNNLLSTVKTAI
jgi:hypothetical protein